MNLINELSGYMNEYLNLFWGIGYFGWQISALYAFYISYHISWKYLIIFFIVLTFSGWLNHHVLKKIIFDARPIYSTKYLYNDHFQKISNGMPSGHAQMTALSLTYSYLITGKYLYESILLFAITIFQRYVFKNHTLNQLLVGGVIGFITGILLYLFLHKILDKINIKNVNKNKV